MDVSLDSDTLYTTYIGIFRSFYRIGIFLYEKLPIAVKNMVNEEEGISHAKNR